jgi:hypothetical protein
MVVVCLALVTICIILKQEKALHLNFIVAEVGNM